MNDLRNLAINVVAGVLLFVLGVVARQMYSWIRSLSVGRFWRPLAKGGVTLVIGSFAKGEFLEYEPSGVVGIGDLRALHELIDIFGRARLTRFKIAYVNTVTADDLKGNVVLFGGGDANGVALKFLNAIKAKVEFVNETETAPPVLKDVLTGTAARYQPTVHGGKVTKDYGFLIRARNPDEPRNWVVIIAGCLGFGTWAGVQLTGSPDLARAPEEFECIYQTAVNEDVPGSPRRIIGIRRLIRS